MASIIILIIILLLVIGKIEEKKELRAEGIKNLKELKSRNSDLEKDYQDKKANLDKFKEETKQQVIKEKSSEIEKYIKELKQEKESLEKNNQSLILKFEELNAKDYGMSPTDFEFEKSETYKQQLKTIKLQEKELLRKVNNKNLKGKEITIKTENLQKLAYYAFNTFCDYNLSNLTFKSYSTRQNKLESSYNKISKLTENNIKIDPKLLELKHQELDSSYAYYKLKEEEKQALIEQREIEAENKKAQKELEKKQDKLDKEIEALNIARAKVTEKINSAKDDEIETLKAELAKLQNEIANLQDEKTDIDYRVENTGAGYVYIISNIGSFGEEVYKIGVTRRLDPYQRIMELSSASVPFKFDVHAMIFSYQAYQLEAELHKYFEDQRVNKANYRKEFFNISLEDIKKVLDLHKELTFDFNPEPEAVELRETLEIEGKDPSNIEKGSLKFVKPIPIYKQDKLSNDNIEE